MNLFNWLKKKTYPQNVEISEGAPAIKIPNSDTKRFSDIQQKLWDAQSSSAMKSLISGSTDEELTNLIDAIAFADFPLNALASGERSLEKRSTLSVHFAFQLLKAGKHSEANKLLTKILDKMRAKLSVGTRESGVVPSGGKEQAFESAFASGDMGSATEILKQCRSTDFWRIDEVLKQELYDFAMEMLRRDKSTEAAILLDAVLLDYPQDLETEFWRAASYNNIYNNNKSDIQAKEKAKVAISSFLHKADGKEQFTRQCSSLRQLLDTNF